MSTLTTIAVLAVVVVFGLPILGTFAGGAIQANQDAIDEQNDSNVFGNNPAPGKIICDLKITVYGELDFQDSRSGGWNNSIFHLGQSLAVFMGEGTAHPEIAKYQWVNCYKQGTMSFIPLMAYDISGNTDDLVLFAQITTFGDSFDLQMNGVSATNGKVLTEKSSTKVWTQRVDVKDWDQVELPLVWSEDFFLEKVVVDDYTLYFRAVNKQINEQGANQPISYDLLAPEFG